MKRYIKSSEITEYWYFTTHGVQPGAVPKGYNILDIQDTANGSYFKTDKVIPTADLRKYDIRERVPEVEAACDTVEAAVDWSYFNKFHDVINQYMPPRGEGDNMASQTVTAVNKIIYKWYNDGDVYDNTYGMQGWMNDLSSYANWLAEYVPNGDYILDRIDQCYNDSQYEDLLKDLAECYLDADLLEKLAQYPAEGSIYDCRGSFKFRDPEADDDEWKEEEEDEWEEEYDEDFEFEEDKE